MDNNIWAERYPSPEIVADELRRLRYEMATAVINERAAFIQDLRETMSHPTRFRDRRKVRRTRRAKITRQGSTVDFTQRQLALGERILRDFANKTGGDS